MELDALSLSLLTHICRKIMKVLRLSYSILRKLFMFYITQHKTKLLYICFNFNIEENLWCRIPFSLPWKKNSLKKSYYLENKNISEDARRKFSEKVLFFLGRISFRRC
jgi:hypothetical protein